MVTTGGLGSTQILIGTAAITIGATVLGVLIPATLLMVPLAAAAWSFRWPAFRFFFFVFGALAVFQTAEGLTPQKMGYLGGVALSVLISSARLRRLVRSGWGARFQPALMGASILALWILGPTLIIAVANGVPLVLWSRDALTYLLISAGVIIGIDAAASVSLRSARITAAAVGVTAAVGFAAAWINRRGLSEADYEQGLLASMVALTIPLAMCLTLALAQRSGNLLWMIGAAAIMIAVLVTGTRTGVVLAVTILGIVGAASKMRVTPLRAGLGAAAGLLAVGMALPIAGAMLSSERFVRERLNSILDTLTGGFGQDYSGLSRERAYSYAWEKFEEFPLFGQGLGVFYFDPDVAGTSSSFTIDTPFLYLAKFGVVGSAILVLALALVIRSLLTRGSGEWSLEITMVRGALLAWIAILPFGPTTEDKGFALSVALAVLLIGASARKAEVESSSFSCVNGQTTEPAVKTGFWKWENQLMRSRDSARASESPGSAESIKRTDL